MYVLELSFYRTYFVVTSNITFVPSRLLFSRSIEQRKRELALNVYKKYDHVTRDNPIHIIRV